MEWSAGSLPPYQCSLRGALPPRILQYLDKLRRRCLWTKKTEQGDKYSSLAAWELVCSEKNWGCLVVLDIKLQNKGLLLKYINYIINMMSPGWIWFGPHTTKTRFLMLLTTLVGPFGGVTLFSSLKCTVVFWKLISQMAPRPFSARICGSLKFCQLLIPGLPNMHKWRHFGEGVLRHDWAERGVPSPPIHSGMTGSQAAAGWYCLDWDC